MFSHILTPPQGEGTILVLLGGGDGDVPENCAAFAQRENARVVTPLFASDGGICAAYIEPGRVVIQRECFGENAAAAGTDVTVFDTALGKLALACGADIFQPQYARLAALRGCQMLIAHTCEPLSHELLLAGPWSTAQANCLPIAAADEAQGSLILPCPMTNDKSGLGRTWFDTGELARAYAEFPVFGSLNRQFCVHYVRELS